MRVGEPLRVLHIVTSDAYAGIERHVVQLSAELRELGDQVRIACPPTATVLRLRAADAQVPTLPSPRAHRAWLRSTAGTILRSPPDLIHVHDGRSAVFGAVVGDLARTRVVRTQHFTRPASAEREGLGGTGSRAVQRLVNDRIAGYIGVSQAVLREAQSRRETGRACLTTIFPGVSIPSLPSVQEARQARAAAADPVLAYVGRFEREKHLDLLLRAFASVLAAVPQCRLVLAGRGSEEANLRSLAEQLAIGHAIAWPGWVDSSAPVLAAADVYVNPLAWEGFGMATAEAMAHALPVVAVDSGASPELVENQVTGLLVPSGSPAALASALVRLADDRPWAAAMGWAGRDRAAQEFGVERTASKTRDFYRLLMTR